MHLLSLLWACTATANPYLDSGRTLFQHVQFREAETQLLRARSVPTSTPAEKYETLDLLARSIAAQGRLNAAIDVYALMLSEDPHAPPPEAAPKIRQLFLDAKHRLYAEDYVRLEVSPSPANEIAARIVDPWNAVTSVQLLAELENGERLNTPLRFEAHAAKGPWGSPRLPGASYWLMALDKEGHELARIGPLIPPGAAPSLVPAPVVAAPAADLSHSPVAVQTSRRWPAWVVGAISVAALAAGAAVAYSATQDYRGAGETNVAIKRRSLDAQADQKAIAANVLVGGALVGGAATAILAWRF